MLFVLPIRTDRTIQSTSATKNIIISMTNHLQCNIIIHCYRCYYSRDVQQLCDQWSFPIAKLLGTHIWLQFYNTINRKLDKWLGRGVYIIILRRLRSSSQKNTQCETLLNSQDRKTDDLQMFEKKFKNSRGFAITVNFNSKDLKF